MTIPPQFIHPMLVHFPIVLLLLLIATDYVLLFGGYDYAQRNCMANLSVTLAVLTGLSAIPTYLAGRLALGIAIDSGVPATRLDTHAGFGTIIAAFLVIWALVRLWVWWRRTEPSHMWRALFVAIETGLGLLILITSYYGGQLVYEYGVNVGAKAAGAGG